MNQDPNYYLGKPATDKFTGFSGTITAVMFEVEGNVSVLIEPKTTTPESERIWRNVKRLSIAN